MEKKKKRSGNLWSGTIKDRCQLRIGMVYYHVRFHARRLKCAMVRWTTNVRDLALESGSHFHLSRRNVHVSLHAPECFTELARDSGDRSGYTVVLEPLP